MITIVFVEENSELIEQLRVAAAAWQDKWDVHLATGPTDALELIDRLGGADVVITNMDMEGMDGAQLLTIVRNRFPATARIVLSHRSGREALLRAVGPAHQYLAKPIDIDELAQVIEHVRGESVTRLRDPIRSLIGQADRLPSPPQIFQDLMTLVESDDWTVKAVAELLGSDVALTTEIMKLVNSTFFGFFGEVTSVERAVSLLGVDLVRSVVLGSGLFATDPALENWLDLDRLDRRSKAVAHGARTLALRDGAPANAAAAAYLAGMVSEVGMLVMARVGDVDRDDVIALNVWSMPEVERLLFGGDRFEVGSQLLRLWGFSPSIVEAVSGLGTPWHRFDEGLPWHLWAARRLVAEEGFALESFSAEPGESAEFDRALQLLEGERAAAIA